MTKTDISTNKASSPNSGPDIDQRQTAAPRALHQPFSWLAARDAGEIDAEFYALTFDICRGAAVVAEVAMADDLSRSNGSDTLFDFTQMEKLHLLAQRSLEMLGNIANERIDSLNDRALAAQVAA